MEESVYNRSVHFGARLRQARHQAGLTLEALARRTGLSRAAISKIERGERQPTLPNALRLAEGVGKSLPELLGEAPLRRIQVTRPGAGRRLVDPETGAVRETLLPLIHGVEVIHYELPARQTTGTFHAHRPGTVELFVVMAGQLVVQAGDEQVPLAAGDLAAVAADVAHGLSNPGAIPCAFFLFIIPPG